LNIASFLVGATEFLTAIRTDPGDAHVFLETVTRFVADWIALQLRAFDTIEGVFILDDIVGFLGREDFELSALPYLSKIFNSFDVPVKFFHNDAQGLVCAPYLQGMGVNLFNFSSDHTVEQMRSGTGPKVTLLGGIPPRDVMASGTPEDVSRCASELIRSASNEARFIPSCGGGMPPGVSSENIRAFISAVTRACRLR
jgi:uroporphyrinogen decarboxylase